MLHALILAGGFGMRLWPASRIAQPKHLLSFEPPQTLLQATLDRLADHVPPEKTWIVTSKSQLTLVAETLPYFDATHIWSEPIARNTAASIGLAAVKLRHIDPDAVMLVLPADHIIKPATMFCDRLRHAVDIVEKFPQRLVTIGVKPTFPATGYGYIQRGQAFGTSDCFAYDALRFCEKPDRETAEKFCQSGEFYWNAGIFVWKAETILELLRHFEPEIALLLDEIARALDTPEEERVTDEAFQKMKSISIDYAVMERAENITVLEAAFEWNDVGTWTALDRLYADQKDDDGNLAVSSNVLAIDSTNCTVRSDEPEHLVVLIGLQGIVVIQTADATLIVPKEKEESVCRVVEELEKHNLDRWR